MGQFHSKRVIFNDEKPQTLRQKLVSKLESTKVGWWLSVRWERIKRSWAYARYAWENYDFDAAYALELLSFKLKRVERVLKEDAHTEQEPEHMQALRLVIRLLDKLTADDYRYFYETHNKKWYDTPYPDMDFEKTDDAAGSSRIVFAREHLPAEQQDQDRDELLNAFETDESIKARDKRWAFSLLAKYYEYWWD